MSHVTVNELLKRPLRLEGVASGGYVCVVMPERISLWIDIRQFPDDPRYVIRVAWADGTRVSTGVDDWPSAWVKIEDEEDTMDLSKKTSAELKDIEHDAFLVLDGECCTPSCGERACGPDGCGGTCGAECREGAACDGLVCADIACGADPSRDCIVEQCAGIGLPLLLQSSEFYAGCWGAVREEYIRNGCPTGSLHDFYCGTGLCEKFPNSSCY